MYFGWLFRVDHKDVIHDKLCKFWCFYLHHYVLGSWPRNKSQFTTYKEYRKRVISARVIVGGLVLKLDWARVIVGGFVLELDWVRVCRGIDLWQL